MKEKIWNLLLHLQKKTKTRKRTFALGVSRRRPTVLIIWQRHSKSSAISLIWTFFFFSSSCLIHLCRIPSCNISSLPSSPINKEQVTFNEKMISTLYWTSTWYCYIVSSQRQQSVGRHVASLTHITLRQQSVGRHVTSLTHITQRQQSACRHALHSHTLSWFRANQSLLFLLNTKYL